MMSTITNSSSYKPDAVSSSVDKKISKPAQADTLKTEAKSKVETIKEQIANGTYELKSSSVLAKKLYESIF